MEAVESPAKKLYGDRSLAPETAKSLDPDAKTLKEASKSSALSGSVGKSWENRVRVSMNGSEVSGGQTEISGAVDDGLEDSELNGVSSLLKMKGTFREVDVNGQGEAAKRFGSLLGFVDKSKEVEAEKMDSEKKVNCDAMNGREDAEADGDDWGSEFSVGDFVWGKIRSHPWWPGQIYDSSDASDYAVKLKQRDRLLVAYFGDGSFAWCHPSQLKPFGENFEEMSQLSNSKNFHFAVQEAVAEIRRLVELKMTCSCVLKGNSSIQLSRPQAVNAGIKKGAFVPESGIEKLSVGLFEPAEIVDKLKHMAKVVSMSNLLDGAVLKGWLSAFFRSKGHCQLPIYQETQAISSLEDNIGTLVVDISDYSNAVEVPVQGPAEENWISSYAGPTLIQDTEPLLKGPEDSEDRECQRRKQKSIAEIMEGDSLVKNEEDVARRTNSGQPELSSRGKRKAIHQEIDDGESNLIPTPRKYNRTKHSGLRTAGESKVNSSETYHDSGAKVKTKGHSSWGRNKTTINNDGDGDKEENSNRPVSLNVKMNGGLSVVSSDAETKEQIGKGSLSRERKKSRYLSPPYTNPSGRQRKMEIEAEALRAFSEAQLGEQMTKAATEIVGSPPILDCTGGTIQKVSEERNIEDEASDDSTRHAPEQCPNRLIDLGKVELPTSEVLTEVRRVALCPQYQKENNFLDIAVEVLSGFRSSVYRNGSNYKMYKQCLTHRKRKSVASEPASSGKDQNQVADDYSSHKSQPKKMRKNSEMKSDKPASKQAVRAADEITKEAESNKRKTKQVAGSPDAKKMDQDTDGETSPAALYLTFEAGASMPSKDDLIKIYGKYGSLNTEATNVFCNHFFAYVVFRRSSDAEEAYRSTQRTSPFKSAIVNFRLHYLPPESEAAEVSNAQSSLAKKRMKTPENNPSASHAYVIEASQLNYIRHKLEMMASILETPDGKISPGIKSRLEGEIKGLLKKVSMMTESSS